MKLSKPSMARLGRAVIAAFAAQVVAGAMCLMPAVAMAAPQASASSAMPACTMDHGASPTHARHACPHCDAPDSITPSHIGFAHPPAMAFVAVVAPSPSVAETRVGFFVRPIPTGPPRSASLLLTQTKRLRI